MWERENGGGSPPSTRCPPPKHTVPAPQAPGAPLCPQSPQEEQLLSLYIIYTVGYALSFSALVIASAILLGFR